jgi:hypothetical protein
MASSRQSATGWAGAISYGELAMALQSGYASASTNAGHDGNGSDASFALGHPEKVYRLCLARGARDDAEGEGADR